MLGENSQSSEFDTGGWRRCCGYVKYMSKRDRIRSQHNSSFGESVVGDGGMGVRHQEGTAVRGDRFKAKTALIKLLLHLFSPVPGDQRDSHPRERCLVLTGP